MPVHGGFAYAIQLRQRVLSDAVLLAYHTGKFSRRLAAPLIEGPPNVSTDFFIDPPAVTFDPARPGRFLLTIGGLGRLSVLFDQTFPPFPEARTVQFQMVVALAPRFVLSGSALEFLPEPSDVSLDRWTFTVIGATPYSAQAQAYLTSPVFRERLEANLVLALTSGLLKIPPIQLGGLGAMLSVGGTSTAGRVDDDSILIGVNVQQGAVQIVGQLQELTSFAGSHDVGLAVNAALLPVIFAASLQQVQAAVAEEDATLQSLEVTAGHGRITVSGRASNSFGSVTFSLDAVLALTAARTGKYFQYMHRHVQVNTRIWPAVAFHVENVKVSVDPATWVRVAQVAGLVTGAVVPLFIQDLIRGAAHAVTLAAQQAPTGPAIPRVQRIEPERPGDPRVKLRINEFTVDPDGLTARVGVTPQFPSPTLMGLTSVPANFIDQPIRYRLVPPVGTFDDDPRLRVRWRVQNLSLGTLVVDDDGQALGRLTRDLRVADFGGPTVRLGLSCFLYRRVGTVDTPLFDDGFALDISAPLLPGALTRWRYQVKNPQVAYSERAAEWQFVGESRVQRWSAVHRLDRPCAMATKQSRYATSEVLAEFPYPLTEVAERREGLCAYCFFGGPGEGKRPFL